MTTEELFEKFGKILIYDFEVFKKFWCVVIASAEGVLSITDQSRLVDFYDSHRDWIWIGYNSNHYDKYILGAVYNGWKLGLIYAASQDLIEQGRTQRGGGPPVFRREPRQADAAPPPGARIQGQGRQAPPA